MKKASIILSVISLCLLIVTVAITTNGYASNDGVPNTINRVVDESVNIPEPEDSKGKAPDKVRWEPMLGCYIVKDAKYDPVTKSFIIPEDGISTPVNTEDENERISKWVNENSKTTDKLYLLLIEYEKNKGMDNPLSSIRSPETDSVVNEKIIPLGISYLDEMMDMVFNKKMFDVPLMYAIDEITSTSCKPQDMNYDDFEETHDKWRGNMKALLNEVDSAAKSKKDLDKYGIFVLPYIEQYDPASLDQFINAHSDTFSKSASNGDIIDVSYLNQIRDCVEKYKN